MKILLSKFITLDYFKDYMPDQNHLFFVCEIGKIKILILNNILEMYPMEITIFY